MKTELNIGILGCGPTAQAAHLESAVKAKNARLYAICDLAQDLADRMAAMHSRRATLSGPKWEKCLR